MRMEMQLKENFSKKTEPANHIYKSPINLPKTGHELITCHYPLRLDTYSGCIHNCIYCYAKNLLEPRGYWRNIRSADPTYIEYLLEKYIDDGFDGAIGDTIRERVPFRLGGLTDCFQAKEKEQKITKRIIETLNHYDYPYLIVTKSPLISEYVGIMDERLAVIQITITTLREELAKLIEPNAYSPQRRLNALRDLSETGYFVTARFSPIIPNVNLEERENLMEAYSSAGAKHVLVEFFRGNKEMIENIEKIVKINLISNYVKDGYYYRFELKNKLSMYRDLKILANNLGMSFSICTDGDPVPFQLNDTKNCCGTDHIKKFKGIERVASNLFQEAKLKGKVALRDMEKYWTPVPKIFESAWFRGEFERFIFGLKWDGYCYKLSYPQNFKDKRRS